jgi:hypothetical protein
MATRNIVRLQTVKRQTRNETLASFEIEIIGR